MGKIHLGSSNKTNQLADFYCPGCNCSHGIVLGDNGPWKLTGGVDNPTITPSILIIGNGRCHSSIQNGMIEFLSDCEHELAGQIVELPEWKG